MYVLGICHDLTVLRLGHQHLPHELQDGGLPLNNMIIIIIISSSSSSVIIISIVMSLVLLLSLLSII